LTRRRALTRSVRGAAAASLQADPSADRTPLYGRLSYENERLAASAAATAAAVAVG